MCLARVFDLFDNDVNIDQFVETFHSRGKHFRNEEEKESEMNTKR